MQLRWAGSSAGGASIDVRDGDLSAEAVLSAVRDPSDPRIRCRSPGPVTDRVGVVSRGVAVSVRSLVATALRTHRVETPYDRMLAHTEWQRDRIEVPTVELESARAELAAVDEDITALREEVARLGGRVETLREIGGDVEPASAELQAAITRLSELETEQAAAEQRLAAARERAADMRDARDRRRALADRIDNLRRDARDWLVAQGYDRFREAIEAVDPDVDPGHSPESYDGPDWVAAVAALRLAREPGPAVLAGDLPFASVRGAQQTVQRPTIFVEV